MNEHFPGSLVLENVDSARPMPVYVPVQVDVPVVPVQGEKGSIEKMDASDSPALVFKPEVNHG